MDVKYFSCKWEKNWVIGSSFKTKVFMLRKVKAKHFDDKQGEGAKVRVFTLS